jgi:SEC-C motif-containing protein
MAKRRPARPCPCGSGRAYAECCRPAHQGQAPSTAEALMRSRYSAYALDDTGYVLRSWHPETRPPGITSDPGLRWTGLSIVGVAQPCIQPPDRRLSYHFGLAAPGATEQW